MEKKPAIKPRSIKLKTEVISFPIYVEREFFDLSLLDDNLPEDSQNNM